MGGKSALGDSPDLDESGNVLLSSVACLDRVLTGIKEVARRGTITCQESFAVDETDRNV